MHVERRGLTTGTQVTKVGAFQHARLLKSTAMLHVVAAILQYNNDKRKVQLNP